MKAACRIKPIAPPTLVALALVMAAGAPGPITPQPSPARAIEQARVIREDRDGEQVAQLIAAINAAAHKLQPRATHPIAADITTPCTLAAALRMPRLAPHLPPAAPPSTCADGRLHLIDLPPPALCA